MEMTTISLEEKTKRTSACTTDGAEYEAQKLPIPEVRKN